jgi:hypothetical protein
MILRWIDRTFNLLVRLFIVSILQISILSYSYLGEKLVAYNDKDLSSNFNCSSIILQRLSQLDVIAAIGDISRMFVVPLVLQIVALSVYSFCRSRKSKKIATILIWLAPAISLFSSQITALFYFLSPLAPPLVLWEVIDISSYCRAKNFYPGEGLHYSMALLGLFNLFWLIEMIKIWFFPRIQVRARSND